MDLPFEKPDKPLPNGWKMSPLAPHKIDEHLKEVRSVAAQLADIPRIKIEAPKEWNGKPVDSLTLEERQAFYFSMQAKSTQDALARQKTRKPEDDIDWLLRPMPDCLAVPDAKDLDALTAMRQIDPMEYNIVQASRHNPNTNTIGQSTKSSVTPERREKGIHAFTYSKPANPTDDDIRRLKKLQGLEAVIAQDPPKEEPKRRPWWKFWRRGEFEKNHKDWDWREDPTNPRKRIKVEHDSD